MAGTSLAVTAEMDFIPPMMTSPITTATTSPKPNFAPSEPRKPSSPPVTLRT
nr:hypothetical protein [Rhodococcus sp. SORGH_AS_0301]